MIGIAWHNGIISGVRLVDIMPAKRATSRTLPFSNLCWLICKTVSRFVYTTPFAIAVRSVSGFGLTSTICVCPFSSKCVSFVIMVSYTPKKELILDLFCAKL